MNDLRVSKKALEARGPNPTLAILEAVLAKVSEAELQSNSSQSRAAVMRQLTPGQRAVFAVTRLEMEVNSGGFDSYFRYPAGDYSAEALAGLQLVGAVSFARVLSRAMALFPGSRPDPDTDRRADELDRVLEKAPDALEDLLGAFLNSYEGEESLGKLLVAYIRAHPDQFVAN